MVDNFISIVTCREWNSTFYLQLNFLRIKQKRYYLNPSVSRIPECHTQGFSVARHPPEPAQGGASVVQILLYGWVVTIFFQLKAEFDEAGNGDFYSILKYFFCWQIWKYIIKLGKMIRNRWFLSTIGRGNYMLHYN